VSNFKSIHFTPFHLVALGILTCILCGICAGTGLVAYGLGLDLPRVAGVPPPATPPISQPTGIQSPVVTSEPDPPPATPMPTPLVKPTVLPSAAPSPTATYVVAPALINQEKIAEITSFVEQYRQLALPDEIPIKFLTRRQLQEQWRDTSFDVAALEAVQTQQEFYRALNLIEPGVDLVEAAFASQTDIMLGYYTPKEKAMVIIAESVNMFAEEEMTFAHEYVHALQDYHFDLSHIFDEKLSGDALLAARSLPEGDARLVEDLFTQQNIRQDEIEYNIYRYLFREHPQLEGVSPALGIFTYFPYTAGEYFVVNLFIQGGYSWDLVNQAYEHLPVSSEQVMHPEKYLAGEAPTPVTLPELAPVLGADWHEIDRDVLGEAGFLVWLVDQVDQPTAINGAAGWDGDTYSLWVDAGQRRLLVESSIWATETEATEFAAAFRGTLPGSQAQPYPGPDATLWENNGGVTLLTQVRQRVLLIIAPDQAILDRVRAQFAGF
jgi:hypothetical protein